MSVYFHFKVDPNYLGAGTPTEIAVVTFVQIYETIIEPLGKPETDLATQGIIADSISQIIDILTEIKKWELNEQFYDMRNTYLDIMKDHYTSLVRNLSSD